MHHKSARQRGTVGCSRRRARRVQPPSSQGCDQAGAPGGDGSDDVRIGVAGAITLIANPRMRVGSGAFTPERASVWARPSARSPGRDHGLSGCRSILIDGTTPRQPSVSSRRRGRAPVGCARRSLPRTTRGSRAKRVRPRSRRARRTRTSVRSGSAPSGCRREARAAPCSIAAGARRATPGPGRSGRAARSSERTLRFRCRIREYDADVEILELVEVVEMGGRDSSGISSSVLRRRRSRRLESSPKTPLSPGNPHPTLATRVSARTQQQQPANKRGPRLAVGGDRQTEIDVRSSPNLSINLCARPTPTRRP